MGEIEVRDVRSVGEAVRSLMETREDPDSTRRERISAEMAVDQAVERALKRYLRSVEVFG